MARKKKAGIAGHPPEAVLEGLREGGYRIIDLDVPSGAPLALADAMLPRVFCAVLRTVAANALRYKPEIIVADAGEGKCDGMRMLAAVLADNGFRVETTRNRNKKGSGFPVCVSGLPLRRKMKSITDRLVTGRRARPARSRAAAGFWGVPPADNDLLDLFPDDTHVFGWTRCLENGTPSDLGLEIEVDPSLPTVFYAQSFCQKNAMARHLAARHNGLYIEAGDRMTRADRAKIEAFLEMNFDSAARDRLSRSGGIGRSSSCARC